MLCSHWFLSCRLIAKEMEVKSFSVTESLHITHMYMNSIIQHCEHILCSFSFGSLSSCALLHVLYTTCSNITSECHVTLHTSRVMYSTCKVQIKTYPHLLRLHILEIQIFGLLYNQRFQGCRSIFKHVTDPPNSSKWPGELYSAGAKWYMYLGKCIGMFFNSNGYVVVKDFISPEFLFTGVLA